MRWLGLGLIVVACGGDQELALLPKGGDGGGATGGAGGVAGDAGGGSGGCEGDQQCVGEKQLCNPEGRCVRCLASAQCELGKACDPSGECRESCGGEADCTSNGKHCDLSTGACVECRPAPATDCTSGDEPYCVLGECKQCDGPEKPCLSSDKKQCWNGECVECLIDGHCDLGKTCDPLEHQCKGG